MARPIKELRGRRRYLTALGVRTSEPPRPCPPPPGFRGRLPVGEERRAALVRRLAGQAACCRSSGSGTDPHPMFVIHRCSEVPGSFAGHGRNRRTGSLPRAKKARSAATTFPGASPARKCPQSVLELMQLIARQRGLPPVERPGPTEGGSPSALPDYRLRRGSWPSAPASSPQVPRPIALARTPPVQVLSDRRRVNHACAQAGGRTKIPPLAPCLLHRLLWLNQVEGRMHRAGRSHREMPWRDNQFSDPNTSAVLGRRDRTPRRESAL